MNDFLKVTVKVSFLVLTIIGVLALGVGIVLYLCPDLLLWILHWGCIGALTFGGAILTLAALYGFAAVCNVSGKMQKNAKTP